MPYKDYTKIITKFLSTPSARRATYTILGLSKGGEISIHALREEGDLARYQTRGGRLYFYPRPPRGGRLPGVRINVLPV